MQEIKKDQVDANNIIKQLLDQIKSLSDDLGKTTPEIERIGKTINIETKLWVLINCPELIDIVKKVKSKIEAFLKYIKETPDNPHVFSDTTLAKECESFIAKVKKYYMTSQDLFSKITILEDKIKEIRVEVEEKKIVEDSTIISLDDNILSTLKDLKLLLITKDQTNEKDLKSEDRTDEFVSAFKNLPSLWGAIFGLELRLLILKYAPVSTQEKVGETKEDLSQNVGDNNEEVDIIGQ